ncbi:MAG TPA: ZIP family metal transporter [Bacillota bacterium]|nr:ZIP family metal transporter [Bacillota bacterium]
MELLILSSLTGLMTLIGAVGVLFFGQPGKKVLAFYLGLSAGIMVLVVLLDLLPAAFSQGPLESVGIGMGLGLMVMMILHQILHGIVNCRPISVSPKVQEFYKMGMMMALAIAFHNVPEGIAIGAGYEAHQELGVLVSLSIALHNVPSGIGIAIPFVMANVRKKRIAIVTLGVSLCTPLGAMLGKYFFVGSTFMVSMGIAFAAGAMGYIVWKEIGPTALRHDKLSAQLGMAGSIVILYIVHILR